MLSSRAVKHLLLKGCFLKGMPASKAVKHVLLRGGVSYMPPFGLRRSPRFDSAGGLLTEGNFQFSLKTENNN